MALERKESLRMKKIHLVTHRSFYDQFMDQWRESPTYTLTILVVLPIAMAINGLHAVWVEIKNLVGFG
jgi:hypothetical protein